ncbi:two pore domain potassium channel family protein [Ancylobacter dichloromethanicus]|uniref:Metal transporter n=1 Tax=Ancylobacter dichloromethanicus TaxID=518825 RepID=A0A9W6MY39_9HYPH|nr:ion channel [Ancylobacter dichloromethanicus]MBS7555360.1 two pore domain potassium channel family protein [Ancylobacter dichloromethanicus]GLK70542.1 metal transporter [Ancylobacter dichloromethanicus]
MLNEMITGIFLNVMVMLVHLGATLMLALMVSPFEKWLGKNPRLRLIATLMLVNIVLLTAHLLEVGLWALVYARRELVTHAGDAYYSAFVNYTTLGYGDVLQATRTRLLGPMTAASGILMFGWSTALLIYVLQGHLPRFNTTKN